MKPRMNHARNAATSAGDSPATDNATVDPGPRTAFASGSSIQIATMAGTRMPSIWVTPAAPMPATLPTINCRGDAALIISSMTRLAFSETTPAATHIP